MGLPLLCEEINAKLEEKGAISKSDCRSWLSLTTEISANVQSGVEVLSDFLSYDKIESGKLMLENSVVPIFALIQSTAAEFRTPAIEKRIMLSAKTPLTKDVESCQKRTEEQFVIGDKAKLTQVVRNLISNAVKLASDEGDVTIEATWSTPDVPAKPAALTDFTLQNNESFRCAQVGSVVLTVTDTGAGTTKEQIETVFEQGTQFNANELQRGEGSGLGTFHCARNCTTAQWNIDCFVQRTEQRVNFFCFPSCLRCTMSSQTREKFLSSRRFEKSPFHGFLEYLSSGRFQHERQVAQASSQQAWAPG